MVGYATVLVSGLLALPLPGPARSRNAARPARNESCVGCHPDIAEEWASSLHRQAWSDRVFQKAYAIEPLAFCRGCHAPAADPTRAPSRAAADVGVGCVTCHVQGGRVVGPRVPAEPAHPVVADGRLDTQAACASCHQFDFPARAHQAAPEPMQDTLREHARSTSGAVPCQGCHMPVVDGPGGRHHSHAFAVLGDPLMIRRAVKIAAARAGERTLRLTLTPAAVGHAFPTGDMFRRLEARAEIVGGGRATPVVLARSFTDAPRDPLGTELTFARVEQADTRVPPPGGPPRVVDLELPAASGRVRWQVVYQRMSTPMAEAFGVEQVLDEIVVAQGELEQGGDR
jgi:hypothetical protein